MPSKITSAMNIPVVDFSPWKDPQDRIGRLRVAQEIVDAFKNVGFVYLVNHSLPEPVLDEAFDWTKRFFSLPEEDKMKAPHPEGWAVYRGYSWPGLEKISHMKQVPDVKEMYDMGSETNPHQPNQWLPEDTLPGFRDFMNQFYWECSRVADEVLRAIAIGLDLEDEAYLAKKHSGENHHQRLLHYLPIPAEGLEKERASRCMAHTNWSKLTLLFQDDCGGLEVEDVSNPGTFIPAEPIKNAVVVNAGDVLQMWSNDKLKSINHRVTLPPLSDRFDGENRMTRERFSIPYFVCGDTDALIECIPSCMSEKEPAKYEPTTVAAYHLMRMATLY
ncbi:hypothetical protein SI65_00293 [Aspergillus cristatus]|uniref:Fe2OG dioxygenase domain-containing protein n=1 Tax=Aspergillus cristatus TaxID=573508 RepID=A0A1E3BP12_ASPCR|nr:hypothetical protein SI65_00293 [Aspergillus cristatus]